MTFQTFESVAPIVSHTKHRSRINLRVFSDTLSYNKAKGKKWKKIARKMFCYCRTFNNIFNVIHFKTLKCQNILIICLNGLIYKVTKS